MYSSSNLSVGRALVPVVKADANLPQTLRAVYVGVGGSIVAYGPNGVLVTFPDVPQGSTLLGEFVQIRTASTASGLVGYV